MAMPLGCMFRTHVRNLDSVYVHTRCFSSRRRSSEPLIKGDHLHVKSFFEKQKTEGKSETVEQHPSSYKALLDKRRGQALRSVLIRVHKSTQGVCDALQTLGPIQAAYTLLKAKNYLLVEFKHQETVNKLLQHVSYFPDACQLPVRSRLLYHMQGFHIQRHRPGNSITAEVVQTRELTTKDYLAAESVSSQMTDLHSVQQLSEVGSRLRFLICSMVEDLLRSSLPFCRIDPFGSASNGFGWEGCDLDMMVTLNPLETQRDTGSKFRFLTKRGSEDERVFGQQCLDVVGEMVRAFMPSAYGIVKVLNARVPIIKFHHDATEIDCDLSYTNLSGAKMSELMFLLGENDPRVRVLMTTIKQWAKSCDMTRSHPGPWPANFTLLAMLVFFLQTRSPPVLPSIRHLQALAGPEDHFTIDDVDYAFVTDIRKICKSTNTQSLDELLQEFFHFYTHFDFAAHGLSLIEGCTFSRQGGTTTTSPMHIENPLDLCHNIGKNVSAAYLSKLQSSMLEALQCMESKKVPSQTRPWGLFCLFQPASLSPATKSYSVVGLFEEEGEKGVDIEEVGCEEVGEVEEEGWETDSAVEEGRSEGCVETDVGGSGKSTPEKGSAACS